MHLGGSARRNRELQARLDQFESATESALDAVQMELHTATEAIHALARDEERKEDARRVRLNDIYRGSIYSLGSFGLAAAAILMGSLAYTVPAPNVDAYGSVGVALRLPSHVDGTVNENLKVGAQLEYFPVDGSFTFTFLVPPQDAGSEFSLVLDGNAVARDVAMRDGKISVATPKECGSSGGKGEPCQILRGRVPKRQLLAFAPASCPTPTDYPGTSIPIVISGYSAMRIYDNWAHSEIVTAAVYDKLLSAGDKPDFWPGPGLGVRYQFAEVDYCLSVKVPTEDRVVGTHPLGARQGYDDSLYWANNTFNAHVVLEKRNAQTTANVLIAAGGLLSAVGIGVMSGLIASIRRLRYQRALRRGTLGNTTSRRI